MRFNELICLPLDCKNFLNKYKKRKKDLDLLKELYNLFRVNGKLRFKYSLETSDKYLKMKTPFKVWKTKSGHCYELSWFLYSVLRYVGFEVYYCELPDFKFGDHAFVLVKLNNKEVKLDVSRSKNSGFNPKYRKYIKLETKRHMIGNYYINCAFNVYPWEDRKDKLIESLKYVKLGLRYYLNSIRGERLLKKIEKRLKRLENM